MSKQIYIDSNGNEVLVSGTIINDNNLPHYTGTPTAGTTAEAIGATTKISTTTLSTSGISDTDISFTKTGKVVQFYWTGIKSLSAGGYTSIGTLPSGYRPNSDIIYDYIDHSNRQLRLRLKTNGDFHIYNYGSAITSDFNSYILFTYITD